MFFKKKNEIKIVNKHNIKGEIYIGYCRGHETLILFLNFEGYKERHKRLLLLNFVCFKKMGKIISKVRNNNAVKLHNVITLNDLKKYPNLVVKDEIIIGKDHNLSVPEIEIRLENYYPAIIRLWPSDFQPFERSSSYSEAEVIML